jgi:hypothetical protein
MKFHLEMCVFFIFEQQMHNNIFFQEKNHYHIKEEKIL